MSEWVAVVKGERRPVGPVLVFRDGITPEDRVVSAIFGGEPEASFEIVIARWQRGAWRDWKRGWIIHDVTHWMPLPEPPAAMKDGDTACLDAQDEAVSRLVEAVETLIDAAGTAETTLAHALVDGMIDPNVEDLFDAWLQELIAAAHNGRAALAALDTPPAPDDTPSRTHYASGPEVAP